MQKSGLERSDMNARHDQKRRGPYRPSRKQQEQ
jgi:hypothetical protein